MKIEKGEKNMKAKKLGALLLTASLAAGMLTGCGGKDDAKDSANTNTDAGTGTDDSGDGGNNGEVTELTFYNADLTEDDPWTDPVAQILTEKTGVKLKVDHPVGEDKQRISLMIAEQNFRTT